MKAVTKTYWVRLDKKTAAAALAEATRANQSRAKFMADAVAYYIQRTIEDRKTLERFK